MEAGTRRAVSLAVRLLARPLTVKDREQTADAIVVLGTPLGASNGLTGVGDERVRGGVRLWQRGLAPIICLSGGGAGRIKPGRPREADVMAARAEELGVPASALRVERESLSTADNARRSAALLAAEGCRRVWVVSQPFHTRRSRYWFRRVGLEALAWYDDDSVEFRNPRRAFMWIAREYVAWLRMVAVDVVRGRR
ncbi:MAG TPA: YdcF family protein [Kofleriaceae bacterium]|nr:YdcF family protein [Kofleriaceae bacterium]